MTSHQSEMPLSKNLKAINAGKMWRKGNPPTLLVGMQTDNSHYEKQYGDPLGKKQQTKKTRNKSTI